MLFDISKNVSVFIFYLFIYLFFVVAKSKGTHIFSFVKWQNVNVYSCLINLKTSIVLLSDSCYILQYLRLFDAWIILDIFACLISMNLFSHFTNGEKWTFFLLRSMKTSILLVVWYIVTYMTICVFCVMLKPYTFIILFHKW